MKRTCGGGHLSMVPRMGEGTVGAPLPSSTDREWLGWGFLFLQQTLIKHDKGLTTALQESSSSWEAKLCCFSTGLLGLGRDD